MDYGKPEAGSFAGRFGCEKWFEDALDGLVVHPVAGVAN
jgi:hypothetical protein